VKRLQDRPGHFGFVAEPAYLQKKLEDHRAPSTAMFALFACLEPALWAWDYVTDPAGAQDTLMLRLLYFPLFMLVAIAFRFVKHRRLLALVSMGATLLAEALFVEIINCLQSGMVYGIGGFMFFMFMPWCCFWDSRSGSISPIRSSPSLFPTCCRTRASRTTSCTGITRC
jgi:hypothetical protein